MASTTSNFSLLLLTLLFSCHVHARDSQFFSKVSTNNNNNANELVPRKTEQQPLNKQEQQEPNFIPQNQQNSGYGLYGHESGQLPPTTENLPYNKEFNPSSNNDQYYNNDAYVNPESFSNSRNVQGYTTNPRGNNNYYHGGNSMSNNIPQGIGETKLGVDKYYNNGDNNMYKHGMSDTRFLDNGRYFYDTNSENNYNLNNNNNNNNVNSREFDSRNDQYYNNRGNYGNSYGNNENSYEAKNSMEGYNQNQNQNQEEFQEDEQFMP